MPMDGAMIAGMWMIVAGIGVAAYGLLPKGLSQQIEASSQLAVSAPEDAPLSAAHWRLLAVLVVALVIDIMKPASLGFALPGMIDEYGVSRATASLPDFFAIVGTVVGSFFLATLETLSCRNDSILL